MSNYTVSGNRTEKYQVKRDSAKRISGTYNTQREAEKAAKKFAKNTGGGEVRIQRPDGRFRDSDTMPPAKDPFPPRDKRH